MEVRLFLFMQISAYKHIVDYMDFAQVFKALGDETRLRILNLFLQSGERICVCEIVDALLLPQYKISKSLTMMKHAGLMVSSQKGTWVSYQPNPEATPCMKDLFRIIQNHFKGRYPEDLQRLRDRLALRENGVCVIGFASKGKKCNS